MLTISRERHDASDRLLPSTAFLTLYPRSWFPTRLVHPRKSGAIGGSVVSRRAGPASAGRAVTRRVIGPHAEVSVPCGSETSNVISLHSRLRLWRLVTPRDTLPPSQVGLRATRRIETASPVPRERYGLPRSETPSFGTTPDFASSSSPPGSFDASRVVHPWLAPRFACAREGRGCSMPRSATWTLTRGHEPSFEPLLLSPRRTVVRSASSGRALSSDPPGRATSVYVAVCGVPCGTPTLFTRSSRFESTPTLASSPSRRCHEREHRVSPERCILRRSPPLSRSTPAGSAFLGA